jgi:hypothetical protein
VEGPGEAKNDLIPRIIRASLEHDPLDVSSTRANILGDLERYRHMFFKTMNVEVETDGEVIVYYNIQFVSTRIKISGDRLELVTDLSLVPDQLFQHDKKDWVDYAKECPLEDESFTNHVRFLHNENLFIMELIVLSMGADVRDIRNDLPMEIIPMNMLGTCPFCGTVCRGVSRCQTCGKTLPEEMEFRKLAKSHARRQYGDKLVAVRVSRMEVGRKRELISQVRTKLGTIDNM